MIKIDKTIIDKKAITAKDIEFCEEFIKQNQPHSKDESLHAFLTLEEANMYVCSQQDNCSSVNLALGIYGDLMPLETKNSQDIIEPEDVKVFLEKGINLYLFKITQTDGIINRVEIVIVLEDDEYMQLVDTTHYENKRANRILATLGVEYFKELITAEDLGLKGCIA